MRLARLAMITLLGGCADTASQPPAGSIQVSEQVWMAPVGTDDTGCPQYTAWSSQGAVLTVIQYRRADGSFTPLRDAADCPPVDGSAPRPQP